jgi:hypothetical protein
VQKSFRKKVVICHLRVGCELMRLTIYAMRLQFQPAVDSILRKLIIKAKYQWRTGLNPGGISGPSSVREAARQKYITVTYSITLSNDRSGCRPAAFVTSSSIVINSRSQISSKPLQKRRSRRSCVFLAPTVTILVSSVTALGIWATLPVLIGVFDPTVAYKGGGYQTPALNDSSFRRADPSERGTRPPPFRSCRETYQRPSKNGRLEDGSAYAVVATADLQLWHSSTSD